MMDSKKNEDRLIVWCAMYILLSDLRFTKGSTKKYDTNWNFRPRINSLLVHNV